MKFTDYLRLLDDSDLSVYEVRYVLHVWRRGACWETVRRVGELCGMSKSQAYRAKQSLIKKGWIIEVVEGGRFVQKVSDDVPTGDNSNVVVVPTRNALVPTRDNVVPTRNALPINRTKEVNPTKYTDAGQGDADAEALQRAKDAAFALMEFWAELTRQRMPAPDAAAYRDWLVAFNDIWIACGRDVAAAKAKVQAVRANMIGAGLTILNPAKLPGHVQTMVDKELLPMTARLNGNGRAHNDPEAREAHNRAVFEQIQREYESGDFTW